VGFIAQEVEKVLPEVVNRGEDSYRSLEYGKMVSVVIAAVKELYQQVRGIHADNAQRDQKISALETENRALKTENAAIRSRLDAIEKKLLEN
jgi:outer membrane murein-binding lipoprotein Lpp